MFDRLLFVLHVLGINARWMGWNLFLAFIPLGLSVWLFRRARSVTPLWILTFLVFVAFLPNAPYVLTDIIHLIGDIRDNYSVWTISLVLVPLYLLFMLSGFEAYVLSLINLGYFMRRQGWNRFIPIAEVILHGLSAIGIYLGRFKRFNSWDIVTQLDTLTNSVINDLVDKRPMVVIALIFLVLASLYWLLKPVSLAVIAYYRTPRQDAPEILGHDV